MSDAEFNGWLEVAILLVVNIYLVFVLIRVNKWAKASGKQGNNLFVYEPWIENCGPHAWEKEEYTDASQEKVYVLYCKDCGYIAGQERYFRKEAIERVNAARKNGPKRDTDS